MISNAWLSNGAQSVGHLHIGGGSATASLAQNPDLAGEFKQLSIGNLSLQSQRVRPGALKRRRHPCLA